MSSCLAGDVVWLQRASRCPDDVLQLALRSVCVGAVASLRVAGRCRLALPAAGQEPAGLQAAAALEDVLVKAIAARRAIGRRHRPGQAQRRRPARRADCDPFNRQLRPLRSAPARRPRVHSQRVRHRRGGRRQRPDSHGQPRAARGQRLLGHDGRPQDLQGHEFVGADPRSDLAVLEIEARTWCQSSSATPASLKKGQIVIALGNPYAIARDGQASASWGIVSNLARKDGPSPRRDERSVRPSRRLHQYGTLIQTDAKLNLGTSGGALVNLKGEMVGLTISLAASLGYEQAAGFAIPVDETFHRALKALQAGDARSNMDFWASRCRMPLDTALARQEGRAGRSTVLEGTPADRSGLRDRRRHHPGERHRRARPRRAACSTSARLAPEASVRLTVERDDGA